jgi:hypothetical protein
MTSITATRAQYWQGKVGRASPSAHKNSLVKFWDPRSRQDLERRLGEGRAGFFFLRCSAFGQVAFRLQPAFEGSLKRILDQRKRLAALLVLPTACSTSTECE